MTESIDSPVLDGEFFQKVKRHDLLLKNIARTLDNLGAVAESQPETPLMSSSREPTIDPSEARHSSPRPRRLAILPAQASVTRD